MASHRKKRSQLRSNQDEPSSSTASPTKKPRHSLPPSSAKKPPATPNPLKRRHSTTTNNNNRPDEHVCSLGLVRIGTSNETQKPQHQTAQQPDECGPIIHLCPRMYLGRTPPSMTAMLKKKSLDTTWTRQDFMEFFQTHKIAKQHAMLGIDRDPSFSKQEEAAVLSISRKLLKVMRSNPQGITLERGPEARKSDGKLAQQIPVTVQRQQQSQYAGTENDVNSSQSSSNQSTPQNKSSTNTIRVHPNARIVLKEGDVLEILNDRYKYRVVVNTGGVANCGGGRGPSNAIDLLESSSSSSSDAAPSSSRQSLSSVRTIAMKSDDDDSFEKDTRAAIRLSLQNNNKPKSQQPIIDIASSSSEEDQKPPARPQTIQDDSRFKTPETKKSQAIINLADSSSSGGSSNGSPKGKSEPAGKTKSMEPKPCPVQNTRKSARIRRPSAKSKTSGAQTETSQSKTTGGEPNQQDLAKRLRQKGMRIQSVFFHEQNEEGVMVERPIHEILCAPKTTKKTVKNPSMQAGSVEEAPEMGPILSLESPTKRFWDPSWSGDRESKDSPVTPTKSQTKIPTTNALESKSTATSKQPSAVVSPTDTTASVGMFYWNALNSARPREGAWYLDASIGACNTVPGPSLCKKWMALLTWGPKLIIQKRTTRTPEQRGFSWDGPRMDFALGLWKTAVGKHSQILCARMMAQAPGGPCEWWKTCLAYDDLSEESESESETDQAFAAQETEGDAKQKAINGLRMRSARLEAFLYMAECTLAVEKEGYQKLQDNKPDVGIQDNADDSSSDEDEPEAMEESKQTTKDREKALVLLREIRALGSKPVLRLVAQAMSKFWVSQRKHLGYDSTGSIEPNWALEHEHSEIVQQVATQLGRALHVLRRILVSAPSPGASSSRRRTRRSGTSDGPKVSDMVEILWNAMDLELRERLPRTKQSKEPGPKEEFLLDWVWSLQETMGEEFALALAKKIGVIDHYEDLWEL